MRSIGILISLLLALASITMGQGIITTMAGVPFASCGPLGEGGPATSAQLCGAQSTAVDTSGNIYFFDYGNARIRQITPAGIINTIAGNGLHGTSGDGGPALSASLGSIFQLAVDPSGFTAVLAMHAGHICPSSEVLIRTSVLLSFFAIQSQLQAAAAALAARKP